ncbi:MAG: hypothetical protein J5642_06500 [Bacteroidales bacterium]|nr:hypothetical protein [Bacteroidales bacterium]
MQYNDELNHWKRVYAFQYDSNGNLTRVEQHEVDQSKQDETVTTTTYTYDSQNRFIGWYLKTENWWFSWDISYNEQGDVAKIVQEHNGKQTTTSFSYEYNKHGNWTSRTVVDSYGTIKSTRVIEYY